MKKKEIEPRCIFEVKLIAITLAKYFNKHFLEYFD